MSKEEMFLRKNDHHSFLFEPGRTRKGKTGPCHHHPGVGAGQKGTEKAGDKLGMRPGDK